MEQQQIIQNTKPINPVFAHLGFTRRTVLTKKSIIICFSIFLALALFFGIAPTIMYSILDCANIVNSASPDLSIMNEWKGISSTMLIIECTFFAFNAALVGVLVFLTLFKDGESDGTELITVSKPISRHQILASRYIFTFVLSICIALIQTLVAGISYGIVSLTCDAKFNWIHDLILYPGINNAGPGYFGGIFGGTILSFFSFGLIASSISTVASGKTTRILSLLIMFFSFGIVSVCSQIIPVVVTNPVISTINNKAHQTIDGFVGKTMQQINNEKNIDLFGQSSSSHGYNYNDYKDMKIKSIEYDVSYYGDIYGFDYEYRTGTYYITPNFNRAEINFEGSDAHSSYSGIWLNSFFSDNGINLNKYIINQVGSSPASGVSAITYLNPMNAMLGMMTENIKTIQGYSIPYNWMVTGLLPLPNAPTSGSESKNPFVLVTDYKVADPNWGLMLMWIAVCGILGSLTTVGYLRKDFK